jgi:hypothetical protein
MSLHQVRKQRGKFNMSENRVKKKHVNTYVKREAIASKVNPWAEEMVTTMVTRNRTVAVGQGQQILDGRTGEIDEKRIAVMAIKEKVDKEEFVKLFEGGISNIFNLNKTAKDLFQAILKIYLAQKMKAEMVYLCEEDLKEVGYIRTRQTRTNGMNTLLNLGFLCEVKNKPNQFWVNPSMFFKGNRVKIFHDYAVTGTKAAADMDEEVKTLEEAAKQQSLPLERE